MQALLARIKDVGSRRDLKEVLLSNKKALDDKTTINDAGESSMHTTGMIKTKVTTS
uniref:Uncharacterized protein n=1 Tax=Hyaloperonospora arabidopsidis (strain Emoy2) TaxID=559515 RepID=M4B4H0_HYAAE